MNLVRISTHEQLLTLVETIPNVPDILKDPISLNIFTNPVVASDGYTYDKKIFDQIVKNRKSPITREYLTSHYVKCNSLRSLLNEFLFPLGIDYHKITREINNGNSVNVACNFEPVTPIPSSLTIEKIQKLTKIDKKIIGKSVNLIMVIDISVSMDSLCKDDIFSDDENEEMIHSRLSLIKYALTMITESMTEADTLSIITFSNHAKIILPLAKMSPHNISLAQQAIDECQSSSSTDILSGICLALSVFDTHEIDNRDDCHIFLCTDGSDTEGDDTLSKTVSKIMSKRRQRNKIIPIFSCFGIGEDINSSLLFNISRDEGLFYYIPDFNSLLTSFSNALSNIRFDHYTTTDNRVIDICDKLIDIIISFDGNHISVGIELEIFVDTLKKMKMSRKRIFSESENSEETEKADSDTKLSNIYLNDFIDEIIEDCIHSHHTYAGLIYKSFLSVNYHQWGSHYLSQFILLLTRKCCVSMKSDKSQLFITPEKRKLIRWCNQYWDREPIAEPTLYWNV